jgi:hypothetical protein
MVMNKYHIRFNTKHAGSHLVWRVFENGNEFLVKDIDIKVPLRSETTMEGSETKWNVACVGYMKIVDDVAYISDNNE